MKILHTSDWHIGRTFHGFSTLENLRIVLGALAETVRAEGIDTVVVSGDIFDTGAPSADAYALLGDILRELHDAGATVIISSGNHDSAQRLGFQSEFAAIAGIHVRTDPARIGDPVLLRDGFGDVAVYALPYLEPLLLRHAHPEADLGSHERVIRWAMDTVRTHAESLPTGTRTVVLSHCFATGATGSESERDITSGGIESVPIDVFAGVDYAALGHIHGRATLAENVRYSGAPLHLSFGEGAKPRGAWIVDLDAGGLNSVTWSPLPVPRALCTLTGSLTEVLATTGHDDDWVKVILTDPVRPLDAMRTLRERFPNVAVLEHRPPQAAEEDPGRYRADMLARPDAEVVSEFLEFVRDGAPVDDWEREQIATLVADEGRTR